MSEMKFTCFVGVWLNSSSRSSLPFLGGDSKINGTNTIGNQSKVLLFIDLKELGKDVHLVERYTFWKKKGRHRKSVCFCQCLEKQAKWNISDG